jgi:hypothetical protein
MQADTLGALAWAALILCYAWSVRNLARLGRRPPASDAGAGSTRRAVLFGSPGPDRWRVSGSLARADDDPQGSGSPT